MQRALRARRRKPMFMVDIAVPRDIEPEVAKLEDVYLFTIDDLQGSSNENLASRHEAARDAERHASALEIDAVRASGCRRSTPSPRSADCATTPRPMRAHSVEQARAHAGERDAIRARCIDFLAETLDEPPAARAEPAAARSGRARRVRSAGSRRVATAGSIGQRD